MSTGYLYWTTEWWQNFPWLYDRYVGYFEESSGLAWEEAEGVFVLPTHGRTHNVQRPYVGSDRALDVSAFTFSCQMTALNEEDFFAWEAAKKVGAPISFVPFLWTQEAFQATAGSSYQLARPVAWGIATGVTSGTHPATFTKDGVVDADCASITGQTLTAAETGLIIVRYLPAFKVAITSLKRNVNTVNDMVFSVSMVETIQVT